MPTEADRFYGLQMEIPLDCELASILYVDELIDGRGELLHMGGLTRLAIRVNLDESGSVSAFEERRGEMGFAREDRKVMTPEGPRVPEAPQGG